MKKYIHLALGTLFLGLAASCTDLNVPVDAQYTEYPTESTIALEGKMADVYYAFRSGLGQQL